nr:hypothetical protein [Tanacetum cinerariifolium]
CWNTVAVKQSNDVTRIQSLVDKKKVVVTEATIRDALHLDDAKGVDCLPNEEIFTTLARMNQLGDLSTHSTKYISPALTQKVFANIRRVGKGCSRVETPLFEGMLVAREPKNQGDAEDQGDEEEQDNDNNVAKEHVTAVDDVAGTITSTTTIISTSSLTTGCSFPYELASRSTGRLRKVGTSQRIESSDDTLMEDVSNQGRVIDESDKDDVEVVTTAKLITKVVAAVSETVSATAVVQADVPATPVNVAAIVTTAAPVKIIVPSTRRRR